MVEAAFKRFDERTHQIYLEIQQRREESQELIRLLRDEIHQVELELKVGLEKSITNHSYMTIGILGSLIALVGVVATFAHHFFH